MQLRYVKTCFRGTIHVFPVFSSQKAQRCAIHVKTITPKGYAAKKCQLRSANNKRRFIYLR